MKNTTISCYSEYLSQEDYHYNEKVSAKSEVINSSLQADVMEMMNQIKSEGRVVTLQDTRALSNKFFLKHSISVEISGEVKDFSIEGEHGALPVRLYTPKQDSDSLVLFIHGGGWMQGNLDTHDYLCRKILNILKCKVLSVHFRLAPEHKFPAGLEDVQNLYEWCISENSKQLLGQFSEIYLSGDSSGGNLATALNLKLKKENGHRPNGLLLFYPTLSGNVKSKSFEIFKNQMALTAFGAMTFIEQYVGAKIDASKVLDNELIFPINGDAVAYPKTIIIAAGCDVLLDGQLELFNKLTAHNRPTKLLVVDGAVHGFMTYGKEFDDEVDNVLHKVKEWM